MRVVLAYDGSPCSGVAVDLAVSAAWPSGTAFELVTAADWGELRDINLWPVPVVTDIVESEAAAFRELSDELVPIAAHLEAPGRTVNVTVERGRAADVIVDAAARTGADLVLVGSRGHGAFASALLGSVSAEVVDRSPCPVLVARRPGITRVVLATDGSPASAAAEEVLHLPVLADLPIRVVSVADVLRPWRTGVAPTMYRSVVAMQESMLEIARDARAETAEEAAARLRARGHRADVEVRTGDAGSQVIAAAEAFGADLIVVGSRGNVGLRRFLVGSVARSILLHARASVLVARGPADDPVPAT